MIIVVFTDLHKFMKNIDDKIFRIQNNTVRNHQYRVGGGRMNVTKLFLMILRKKSDISFVKQTRGIGGGGGSSVSKTLFHHCSYWKIGFSSFKQI